QYLYLPRLRDRTVLVRAIEQGVGSLSWEQDAFAYADAYDEEGARYRGLVAGQHANVLADGLSVVVKPEAARRQLDEEQPAEAPEAEDGPAATAEAAGAPTPSAAESNGMPKRFFGSVELDPLRVGRDASQIGEAI